MANRKLETISREEFDRRLDAYNERRHKELQQTEEELTRVEQLLTQYEQTLDEIEVQVHSDKNPRPAMALLRTHLLELATKTTEVASLL